MTRRFFILIMLFLLSTNAYAKTVVVVLDDSGSMEGPFPYATFELQLLTSMLDSRDDKLVIFRTSDKGTKGWPAPLTNKQDAINFLKNWTAGGDTPWQTLENGLSYLESHPAEETFLFVITDGQFNPPPTARQLKKRIQRILDRRSAATAAAWLVIGNQDLNIEQRRALLKAFNDDEDKGYLLSTADDAKFMENFQDLLMQVIGRGAKPFSDFVVANNTVTITPKFPLTKIQFIHLTEDESNNLTLKSRLPGVTDYRLLSEMHDIKNYFNLPGEKIFGTTLELDQLKAIPANQPYNVTFKNLKDPSKIVIVPHMGFSLELIIRDETQPQGKEELVSKSQLSTDHPYYLVARLRDSQGQKLPRDMLEKITFWTTPLLKKPAGGNDQFQYDTMLGEMTREVIFENAGVYNINITAESPGYLIKESNSVVINAKTSIAVDEKLTLVPLCDGCSETFLQTSPSIEETLAELKWAAKLPESARAKISFNIPDDIVIQYVETNNNKNISAGEITTSQLESLKISTTGNQVEFPNNEAIIQIEFLPPYSGKFEKRFSVGSFIQELDVEYVAHNLPETAGDKFALKATELGTPSVYLQFKNLIRTFDEDNLKFEVDGLFSFDIVFDEEHQNLRVSPVAKYCDCFIRNGTYLVTLEYFDSVTLQKDSETFEIVILETSFWERCIEELIAAMLILLLLFYLYKLINTHRFKNDLILTKYMVTPTEDADEYDVKLHKWYANFIARNERCNFDGIEMVATQNSNKVQIDPSSDLSLMLNGQSLQDWFAEEDNIFLAVGDHIGSNVRNGDIYYKLERVE